ncbi:flagellar hook-length control protein FliK [Pseudomonas viridiflava]|uniref:flagellar hook-length control protein FliK n=1 Tax=Pseudomonas viridiflava TaxID=33069 RepID=UPI000F060813|nr:flagellar hook-length control protein FliK [Pseudomonas viridiflava]
MPLATNALLQATPAAASKTSSANNTVKPADSGKDDNSSFSDVYAKQAQAKSASGNDAPVKAKPAAEKDKSVADKGAADKGDTAVSESTTVADSGNALPVEPVATEDQAQSSDEQVDPALVALTPEPTVDPALDPALQALASQAIAQPDADKSKLEAAPATPAQMVQVTDPAQASFDPNADPLDDMPALQFALESAAAKAQQAQQSHNAAAQAGKGAKADNAAADPSQLANNLAALDDQRTVSDDPSTESSDKSFDGLLDSGLKDVKGAAGDTRVDNFADRLAALSQAAQQPRAAAPAVPLMNQPLAMHQSGWSEGVVERVMYLSSQSLKSADIQLEPAELGRLDIRINMAPDQQTQVTFMSAHVGVREALESQMSRLRESFSQQGMGQVDVNVSDQSRNQQHQAQQQEQANNARGVGNGGSGGNGLDGSVDGNDADAGLAVSQPVQRVVGTSEIDYYA